LIIPCCRTKGGRLSTKPRIDRRSRDTRDRIATAFLALGGHGDIDGLSVGRLAREAGIARSTFYAHYQSLDDYMARSFAAMLASLASADRDSADQARPLPVRAILDHIAAAGPGIERLIAHRHYAVMQWHGERALRTVVEARLARLTPTLSSIDRRTAASIIVAGFLALMRDWVEHRRHLPPETVADRFEATIGRMDWSSGAIRA